MVRKGDKHYPVSWEEAAQAAATKLKVAYDAAQGCNWLYRLEPHIE